MFLFTLWEFHSYDIFWSYHPLPSSSQTSPFLLTQLHASHYFLRQRLSLYWELTRKLDWLAASPQGSSCPCFSRAVITGADLSHREGTQTLPLSCWALHRWNCLPSPPYALLKQLRLWHFWILSFHWTWLLFAATKGEFMTAPERPAEEHSPYPSASANSKPASGFILSVRENSLWGRGNMSQPRFQNISVRNGTGPSVPRVAGRTGPLIPLWEHCLSLTLRESWLHLCFSPSTIPP